MKTFDWEKFYNVGIHLMEYCNDEEYQRSAIGRFYYACFGITREYYENSRKHVLPSFNAHSILIQEFENSNSKSEHLLGQHLRHIRRYRNNSDYEVKFRKNNVIKSKKIANDIFNILNSKDNDLF